MEIRIPKVSNKGRLNVVKVVSVLILLGSAIFSTCLFFNIELMCPIEFKNFLNAGILISILPFLDSLVKANNFCNWFKLLTLVNLINPWLCYLDDKLFYVHNLDYSFLIVGIIGISYFSVVFSTIGYFKYGFCKI